MYRKISLLRVIALGAMCAGMFRVSAADDPYVYQTLTNLGPCASSRVLLMNNDTNATCPIEGQGYHDTSNTVAVGQTYWWHDDTPLTDMVGANPVGYFINPQIGANHILYQKRGEGQPPLKLWELVNCRAGSSAAKVATVYHYIPWSSKCQPIDSDAYSAPILDEWVAGAENSNGVRQAAMITMRATVDENGFPTAAVYSPFYEDGVGEIYFDAVNFLNSYMNSHIAVEVATEVDESAFSQDDESEGIPEFSADIPVSKLKWKRQKCEVFIVTKDSGCAVDSDNDGKESIRIGLNTGGYGTKYYRIRVKLNVQGNVRFRIVRSDDSITHTWSDFGDLILLDNIIVSYPPPRATFTPTGIDSEGTGRAQIGRVGAFTEPLLSVGMDTAKPRMTYSANTNDLPSYIPWKATVTKADFVWRWHYLDQAYGPWTTNTMSVSESGTELIGDKAISVTNVEGDIEYFYAADVAGTRYKFFDFANDTPRDPPVAESSTAHVQTGGLDAKDNPWSRIREGASPWQEMHLTAIIVTNEYAQLTVTNDWTMELTADHTWRGFVGTPTNYTGCTTYLRFVGKNLWETNGLSPVLDSQTWYFPPGNVDEIPFGSIAVTNLGETAEENGITNDCSASYLVFEFNDTSGAFTMNRAEYQNFNRWTPDPGKENLFIGDYIRQGDEIITNISYSASNKQEYDLEMPSLPMSRSTSAYWWENFDQMAGDAGYPFNVPFGLNRMTPNGWRASNGMFVNGMFSALVNKTTIGMALQLQGCGLGTLSLIDPADVPQGIGTVGFSARLAQYYEFGDFCYYVDGTADKNYAISAKATMTSQKQPYSDVSIGSPTLSLVAYYRPGLGCYEFRISRVYANYNDLWDATGVMEMAIYKWYKEKDPTTGNVTWTSKKLKSLRLGGNSSTYNPQLAIGRYYTNSSGTATQYVNYFVPATSLTNTNNVPDNKNWTSIYFGAYNDGASTYLEGGVNGIPTASTDARSDLVSNTSSMMSLSVPDSDSPFQRGSYGVCSRECPAAFGNIQRHTLNGIGPYKGSTSMFGTGNNSTTTPNDDKESTHIKNGDWGSTAANRMISWDDRIAIDGVDYKVDGASQVYSYGLCTAPLRQQLYLRTAPYGDSSNWKDAMKPLVLTSYLPTNIVFSPHTTSPANIQIAVGGSFGDARTDVVVDNIELAQWSAEDSTSTDLGSKNKWAYTDAWIAGTTNEVYQGAGEDKDADEDDVATMTRCGHYVKKLSDTDYIYVFTNTTAGALSSYATFTPKVDLTIKEVFVLGGGGGGGPGGGGGGGGSALWITNAVDYGAGETGLRVYVGNGGAGGSTRSYLTVTNGTGASSNAGAGGNSYVLMKNPFTLASATYYGYGGGRGGTFRDGNDGGGAGAGSRGAGGGSARKSATRASGYPNYATGKGEPANDGAPGGGGGGGLRGLGSNGSNDALGSARSVIFAGSDGTNAVAGANGGKGGDGFPISVMGDSEIRVALGELFGNQDVWLGGGGGGGSGINLADNVATWGQGAEMYGPGGRDSGGQGGLYTAGSYNNYTLAMGARGMMYAGGGGGGGTFHNPVVKGGTQANNWVIGGGAGGAGIVVMHIKVKDRFAMLHPMRGSETSPMSISTPFMNGISLFSFSWKWADSNAVLKVQVATNDVDETTIRTRRQSLSDGWTDIGEPIRFSDVSGMSDDRREEGFTNILIGIRAPASGLVRLLMDPAVVKAARIGSTNDLYSMYGAISITGMKVFDEPEIDDRSWWGWNIMPTYLPGLTYLYDPVTIGPGRTCALNFSGKNGEGEDDPLFADDTSTAQYDAHDPFVQTPVFSSSIGAVTFRARLFSDFTNSAWVTLSASPNPDKEEENDTNWTVLTNIEIEAGTTVFKTYSWRIPESSSGYKALRLSTFGAAEGRYNEKESGKPFGDSSKTKNPIPIQRVLIDEITVSQPMSPKVALKNAYPFRHNTTGYESIATDRITGPDEQPILGETFGVQVQVVPAGMEDELDVDSIRIYMGWYAGEVPWGYENWKDAKGAVKMVELKRASDWTEGNLVYRSSPDDADAFIPPQLAGDSGYQIVQYHIWAEYTNKNGIKQEPHHLTKTDWKMPFWYRGLEDPNKLNGTFCAYTVLDSISPKRAWINEVNMFDGDVMDDKHQYLEIAVPQGFDMSGWSLNFLRNDGSYTLYPLAQFGLGGVPEVKTKDSTNSYAFIAIQSPKTKAAGSYSSAAYRNLNDGTWLNSAFEGGIVDVSNPYGLRLLRPTGIIEHEVVFMSTNTSTSRVRYTYEGTNLLKNLKVAFPGADWMYAGADSDGGSLGVYTNHGETNSCWMNSMKQTPGWINMMADGTPQFIDPKYFEPPLGTNLWIYANIDSGSVNTLGMVFGSVTNTSAVLIVPQSADGTFSTSIVYQVQKWSEIDSILTNEYGHAAGEVAGVSGQGGLVTLPLNGITISDADNRKFEVLASARDSSKIAGLIDKADPYYPAVIKWLQNYDEDDIQPAEYWEPTASAKSCDLTLKEMYWLDIPPVTASGDREWIFKAGFKRPSDGGTIGPETSTNIVSGGMITNIRMTVTMMITNRLWNTSSAYSTAEYEPHPPYMLRGLEPDSSSYSYDENHDSNWTSVTFKITGALQNGRVNSIYRPLRWFTFGPTSFGAPGTANAFSRTIDIRDPFSRGSPGYSYEWYKHPGCPIWYRWAIDDETNRPPVTVEQLNDENALLSTD